jgi:hypothetical protein
VKYLRHVLGGSALELRRELCVDDICTLQYLYLLSDTFQINAILAQSPALLRIDLLVFVIIVQASLLLFNFLQQLVDDVEFAACALRQLVLGKRLQGISKDATLVKFAITHIDLCSDNFDF